MSSTLSSAEYLQTGVILNVVLRINPGGLVYMDIQQQVNGADDNSGTTVNGNPHFHPFGVDPGRSAGDADRLRGPLATSLVIPYPCQPSCAEICCVAAINCLT